MYPHERSLVKRLANQPFALIGINSDPKDKVLKARKRENLTWRSFWDGGDTNGPIATAWNVAAWPMIYVLDDQGVIRFTGLRGPAMDQAIDQLLLSSLTTLRHNLKSADPAERGLAVFRMGKYHPDNAQKVIARFSQDADQGVQSRTAIALGLLGNTSPDLLPSIRRGIRDRVAEVRAASWQVLAARKDKSSANLALEALSDEAPLVRQAAVSAIGRLKPAHAEAALVRLIETDDRKLAHTALLALADLGSDRARQLLVAFAEDLAHPDRVGVAVALHRVDPTTTRERFARLLRDEEVTVREQATRVLAQLADLEPLELYVSALQDEAPQVRQSALEALTALDTPRAKEALGAYLAVQVDALLEIFKGRDSQTMRAASIRATELGEAAAPLLLAKLHQATPVGRFYLSQAIGASRHPQVLEVTLKKLHSPLQDRGLRQTYERIGFGYRGSLRSHVEIFLKHPLVEIRESGVRLLSRLGYKDRAAADLLSESLHDEAHSVRVEAAIGLAPKQHDAAREILEQALREGPEALRFPAFLGIMNFAPEIALPVIDDVLDTIQPVHLGNICFRLSQLKHPRATQLIIKAIRRMDPRSQPRGLSYLQRQNTASAARAIGGLLKGDDAMLKRAAINALQSMKHPEAKKILKKLGLPPNKGKPDRSINPFTSTGRPVARQRIH